MGSSRKIASGAMWSTAYNLLNALYGFVAIPILINYFGKAEYGLIGLAQSVNVYIQLMDMGFNSTNVRFFSVWLEKHDFTKVNKLFGTSMTFYGVIGLLNGVILAVVSLFAPSIFNVTAEQGEIIRHLLWILAFAAIFNWYMSCYDQIIKATENVAWIQKCLFLPKMLQIVVLVLTVVMRFSIVTYFILTTFAVFVVLPVYIFKIKKELPFVRFLPHFNWTVFKEVLPYSLNIFSFNIFKFSFVNLCPVFLGILATAESVADYKILFGISSLITMITGVVMGSLLPSTSKIVAREDRDAYYKVAYQGTKYLSIVCCFCVFGLITISQDLLTVYVGTAFSYLAKWLCVMCLVQIGNHILCISSLILSGVNIRALSRMVVFSSLASLTMAWLMIPRYEVGGVVMAYVVYEVMQMAFYYLYYMPKKMEIASGKVLRNLMPFVLIGAAVCVILHFMPHFDNSWLNVSLYGLLFVFMYVPLVWLVLNQKDKAWLLNLVKRNERH